jgi:hypothetical protein
MDLDRRLTFAYMMNKMAPGIVGSPRAESYLRPAYAALRGSLPDLARQRSHGRRLRPIPELARIR